MAFKNLVAFGAGEITPELSERGTLEKFRTGLKKLRNGRVTKMGGLSDRAGSVNIAEEIEDSKMHVLTNKGVVFFFYGLEFKVYTQYNPSTNTFASINIYEYDPLLILPYYSSQQLKELHITNSDEYVYLAHGDKVVLQISLSDFSVTYKPDFKYIPLTLENPTPLINSTGFTTPTGYLVDYLVTGVKEGVENPVELYVTAINTFRIPAGTNQANVVTFKSNYINGIDTYPFYDEIKIYRRPSASGQYGYVGTAAAQDITESSIEKKYYRFVDLGGVADFTTNPPDMLTLFMNDTRKFTGDGLVYNSATPQTALVYQNRLIFNGSAKRSRVFGTRTDALIMTRDYPLRDDSAIGFGVTSDGGGDVHRFFDARGLVVATNVGMYETPSDILKYSTAYAIKKSNIIHDKNIPILGVSSAMMVYDDRLKGIYKLTPNGDNYPYTDEEISIFSAHLFRDKKVVSWDIQNDFTQIFWMVMDDGTINTLAYQNDQMLRAFTWYDTDGQFLEVGVMSVPNNKDAVFLKILRGDKVFFEVMSDRDERKLSYMNFADNAKILAKQSSFAITLHIPENGDLSDSLYLSQAGMVNLPYQGAEGTIFRVFDPLTRNFIEVYVEEFISSSLLKVKLIGGNTEEKLKKRNIDYAITNETPTVMDGVTVDRKITFKQQDCYKTTNVITGLAHLNGKKVSIRKDGFTHASPLNKTRGYDEYTVTGGQITLSDDDYGSIFVVGLPYCTDIGTLAVDTVEQSPVKLESQITNKVWLSFNESRGCYLGSEFPEGGGVEGMDNSEDMKVTEQGIDVNQPILPYSTRDEHTMVGDWNTNSAICIRKVDPQPLGLKAIILDSEIIRR